jgi:O-antigen/teichoic acid export membrane protein
VEQVHQVATTWVVLLSFPVYLLFAGWPGQVLSLFGDEFRAGAPALVVLAVAMLLNLATGNVATVLLMSGRSGLTLAITAGSLALAVGLTFALAPVYGAFGAALAKGASVVFENVAVAVAVRSRIGVRPLSRPLLAAAGLAIACFAVPAVGVHALGLAGVTVGSGAAAAAALAGVAVYAVAVRRLRGAFELAALGAVIPGRLSRRFHATTRKGVR